MVITNGILEQDNMAKTSRGVENITNFFKRVFINVLGVFDRNNGFAFSHNFFDIRGLQGDADLGALELKIVRIIFAEIEEPL